MCCMSGGTKTMTKINAEGTAWGTGKIWLGRRSWLILPVGGMIQLGFEPVTPEGLKLPTLGTILKDDVHLTLPAGLPGWLTDNAPSCLHTDDRLYIVPPLHLRF